MNADLILYRRMRGMFWGGLVVFTVALAPLILLGIGLFAAARDLDPSTIRDLGGPTVFFEGGAGTLSLIGLIVGLLMGATAGSVDAQRGVLRDLVLTGRSRTVIALRRIAGAVTWMVIALAISIALITMVALWLAPDTGGMDWGEWTDNVLVLGPQTLAALLMGAGIALLVGSRGPAVIVYFVLALFVDNILTVIPKVGEWWEHVSFNVAQGQVLGEIAPNTNGGTEAVNSLTVAILLYVAWATIPVIAGLIRLERRDL